MNLQLHLLLLLILLLQHAVVYCLDVRFTNTCITRSSRWMNHNMHCNSVVAGPSHHSFFREQSNSQNYNNHRILNAYSKDLIQSRRSTNIHWSMKNDKSDVNNNNDDGDDDGWGSSSTTTSTLSNDNDIKRDKMIKELSNLKQQQQQARSNKLEKVSTNENDNQRDRFIPIVTIISIVGFGGAYMYETIRLYNNGELYLPFLK